jgi:aminoglycoside phosphotransferase family enzyme/predicted kinase
VREGDDLFAWLKGGAGTGDPAETVHQTPIAWVFVCGDRVLKAKKPVDFGFLDFTTLAQRRWATERELAFNRETAPDVYRTVHALTRAQDGALALDGEGDAVEVVLEMRRFDTSAILANHPERIDAALAERIGRELARVQGRAPETPDGRGAAGLDYVLRSNAGQLDSLAIELGREAVDRLEADTRAAFERVVEVLDARRDGGFVRRCHGDLHLGNIVVEDGRPIFFDCIEFSDILAEIDVLYDLAFPLMDLHFRGRTDAASRVLAGWADAAGRTHGAERLDGLAALPLFQSVRAAVRAHVTGHGGDLDTSRRYLEAAQKHLSASPPRLYAVGGLSGSGKSTLARAVAPRIGAPPGALVVRSDEVRKRLAGVAPTDRLPKSAYTPQTSAEVYAAMAEEARAALRAGWSVVLDAAFLKPAERAEAEALAHVAGVPFQGLWLSADPSVLRARIRGRTGDASDADEAVLDTQLARGLGEIGWRRIDATTSCITQVEAALLPP